MISYLYPKTSSLTPEQEKQTLLQIKNFWGNPASLQSWEDNNNNNSSTTAHCHWFGITCSSHGLITNISLPSQNIYGPIPDSLCNLINLTHIDLYYNYISGQFPPSLYNCSNLQYLELGQNLLVGTIPSDINRISSSLVYLNLQSNNFTGDIPPSIGQLPNIQSLLLNDNLLNGSFPAELGQLSSLQILCLDYNPFTPATIPQEICKLKNLRFLWMAMTNLIGEIPDSFSNLLYLNQLDLSMNKLTGPIPAGIWMLPNLQNLYLYANHLNGEINGTIGALNLLVIDISTNHLSGAIPEGFGRLKNLQDLAMYNNNFSGEIPASIGLLPLLTNIRLFNNRLTGVLPPELGKHSKLWNFDVSDNRISGELPVGLCTGGVLTSLVASDNNLTGRLPESLCACPKLDNIQVYSNSLTGDIPAGMWLAVNLTTVMMNDNQLSGTLPEKVPWKISRLQIANNRFSGTIPSKAGNLQVFEASNNQFSGKIPRNLASFSRLQLLSLGANQISGEIPRSISALRYLSTLNLSHNQLSGEIPPVIWSLPALTTLDISVNRLTGEIPPAIVELKLTFLNLSSNQLSGEVPTALQNSAYNQSFLANLGLCSPSPILNLGACGHKSDGKDHTTVAHILFFVLGPLGLLSTALIAVMVVRNYKGRTDKLDLTTWKLTLFRSLDFNEHQILKSLTEANLIGSGGAGKVYKVILGDHAGEIMAVKQIRSCRTLDSKLEKQFQTEVKILGTIRHANIVKLIACISNVDSKLLVYEYMENKSLDKWLHSKQRSESDEYVKLDWPTRLSIAIGAAKGLCYMHYGCKPPVVHRDVKSSNILLDKEFGAKIADFGLAKELVNAGEPEIVSAVAGSIGYMPPEYAYSRKVNEKVDVYSFGIVLLELTTGRKANDAGNDGSLADWARHHSDGKQLFEALDEDIKDPAYMQEIETVFKLGILCTAALPSRRPTMKGVLQGLLQFDQKVAVCDQIQTNLSVQCESSK
ncbi:Non-specific serine/threonine protein kinase protein [Dioscorea alata]|uniref:Non-specific serine/threonine protein kinase protein n=1 Tax=Dioscorea alata TaxID=55571 RepID=A0ACB7UBC3_DIOAL|nr:Non-specific serine/threonine protein kinase protein [Dioscorea alata]